MLSSIQKFQNELAEWSDGQFGFNRPPLPALRHMREEVDELIADPSDRMEFADVFILLIDSARRSGMTADELLRVAYQKLEINRKRTWGKPNAEGYCKHVEEVVRS